MIWFTLDENFAEVRSGRYVLVYYQSEPHVQRIKWTGSGSTQHPTISCDLELNDGEWTHVGTRPHDWQSSVAVADTPEDAERLLDHAVPLGVIYLRELEEARLKMLASIRLICD